MFRSPLGQFASASYHWSQISAAKPKTSRTGRLARAAAHIGLMTAGILEDASAYLLVMLGASAVGVYDSMERKLNILILLAALCGYSIGLAIFEVVL